EHPVMPQAPDRGKETTKFMIPKPKDNWTDAEKFQEEANYRVLYAIMMAVDQTRHKMIVHCKTVKDAWRVLQRQFKGSTVVKASRLQWVTLEFDQIKMRDEETIDVYYARLCDLVNQSMMLGEEISEKRQVQKIMRTVVPRFREKITALESFQRVASLDVDELLGELRTFEINNNYDKNLMYGTTWETFQKLTISKPLSPKSPLKVHSPMQKSVSKTYHNFVPICHYCGVTGHIRPKCYKMQHDLCTGNVRGWNQSGILVKVHARTLPNNRAKTHQVWVAKKSFNCFAFVLSLRTSLNGKWYQDNGCSRHMTGEPSYLMNIQSGSNGEVTFGDGVSNKVIGTCCLNLGGLPKLTDVEGSCVLTGSRSMDNCYLVDFNEKCLFSNVSEPEIWHQRLGHIGYSHLVKLTNARVVRGVPKIAMKDQPICEPCQLGKQTRTSHKSLNHIASKQILELLHMDLMSPIQVESYQGKKYIFVCVDDFSRYTCVDFCVKSLTHSLPLSHF
ncbi:Zinc knuckle (CCHC-type) family protein, partial [Striga hermonthica]